MIFIYNLVYNALSLIYRINNVNVIKDKHLMFIQDNVNMNAKIKF